MCYRQVFAWNKYCCAKAKPEASTAVQEPSLEIRPHLESNQTRFKNDSNQAERSMRSTDPEASHEKRDTKT